MERDVTHDLDAIRAEAAEEQEALDAARSWLTTGDLARRWHVSPTTVRDIPRAQLPYLLMGQGLKQQRRRYHPADVARYERRRYKDVESAA